MYYVEFYSRKPDVDPKRFRETIKRTDAYWAAANPQDRPKLAIGRTWRLGGPHYIVVWQIDSAARIDEWNEQRTNDPGARQAIEDWLPGGGPGARPYEEFGAGGVLGGGAVAPPRSVRVCRGSQGTGSASRPPTP